MDSQQLEAIRARCETATPGPWDTIKKQDGRLYLGTQKKPVADICNLYGYESEANLYFIAYARQDIPALLDALEKSMARIAYLEELINADVNQPGW